MKKTFEGVLELESVDDGGQARISRIDSNEDDGLFIRFQSWDEKLKHDAFKEFEGKNVRITVEVINHASTTT